MNWLKENWTDLFLFIWAAAWTAGGIYFAVDVVIEYQGIGSWIQVLELIFFLNLAALVTSAGLKTQSRLISEWRKKQP